MIINKGKFMRFEIGEQYRKEEFEKKKKDGKLDFSDKYENVNSQEVGSILEKRREERQDLYKRQKERIDKLEKLEKEGKLYKKDL